MASKVSSVVPEDMTLVGGAPAPPSTFHWTRDVPPAWQADLETACPKSDSLTWLQIVWQPGWPYEPVQRWEIYEMDPRLDHVDPGFLADLKGEDPRKRGEWIEDPDIPQELGGARFRSHSWFSHTQWQLFREHNCYPIRFWIIQGDKGGHVWRMDHIQRNFELTIEGADTPLPGDLPYAEYGQATKTSIMELDRLKQWHDELFRSFNTKTGDDVDAEEAARKEVYASKMLAWLDKQIEDVTSQVPRSALPSLSDLPMGDTQYEREKEAVDERLRKDGSTRSLRQMLEDQG